MTAEFRSLSRLYKGKPALDGFDLAVEPRSFTVLCGPPASGKSVLFRILVGLEKPDAGRVLLAGRDITDLAPAERTVGYVPQSFALYPHLSVADNMAYPLRLAKAPREEIARRVERTAGILSIGHLLKKTPDQLSGGEKQRVAVARGLLKDAEIFVLDDPLVGLDYKLRERLMDELKGLRQELGATFLYATSDSLEALTMAQRLVVVDKGRVVQHAGASDVYHDPRHARALDLVGFPHANLLGGRIRAGALEAGPLRFRVSAPDAEVTAGLRPEAIRFGGGEGAGTLRLDGHVRLVENLGGEAVVYIDCAGHALTATLPISGGHPPEIGSRVGFRIDPADVMLFDAVSHARLDGRAP